MQNVLDILIFHEWWRYEPGGDSLYQLPYRLINLVEGAVWLVIAAYVLQRYLRHRHSPLELLYAGAFALFGLTDFREAVVVHSWLIWLKALNFAAILYLRWIILKRYYPGAKMA